MSTVTNILEKILYGSGSEVDEAFDKLRTLKGTGTVESLLKPLLDAAQRHENSRERTNAIYALGEIGDKRAVPILLEILKEGASPLETSEALKELMERGPFGMSIRSRMINTELPEVRAAAAVALGLIGDRRALQPLIDTIQNDWAWNVQAAVAFALGELGDKSAIPVLELVVKTQKEDAVCEQAQKALSKLKQTK